MVIKFHLFYSKFLVVSAQFHRVLESADALCSELFGE